MTVFPFPGWPVHEHRVPGVDSRSQLIQHTIVDHQMRKQVHQQAVVEGAVGSALVLPHDPDGAKPAPWRSSR